LSKFASNSFVRHSLTYFLFGTIFRNTIFLFQKSTTFATRGAQKSREIKR